MPLVPPRAALAHPKGTAASITIPGSPPIRIVTDARVVEPTCIVISCALGITGGIVPCPAALVVLPGALAIHRAACGLFRIVAFSAGPAAVSIGFGLAMVYARCSVSRFAADRPLTEQWLPLAASAAITVVGITIALQSLASAGVPLRLTQAVCVRSLVAAFRRASYGKVKRWIL